MTPIRNDLRRLKEKAADLAGDLRALEALVGIDDVPSSLNKIRFITEKVLQSLCKKYDVAWGQAEPTLERMIGPLVSAERIPKNVAVHVRTIQTNTSPGSHFQTSALSQAHVRIAENALVEFLEWWCRDSEGIDVELVGPDDAGPGTSRRRTASRLLLATAILAVCLALGVSGMLLFNGWRAVEKPVDQPAPAVAAAPAADPHEVPKVRPIPVVAIDPPASKPAPDTEVQEIQTRVRLNANRLADVAVRTAFPNANPGKTTVQTRVSDDGKSVDVTVIVHFDSIYTSQDATFAFVVTSDGLSKLDLSHESPLPANVPPPNARSVEARLDRLWKESQPRK
jgi:hypothetical protein